MQPMWCRPDAGESHPRGFPLRRPCSTGCATRTASRRANRPPSLIFRLRYPCHRRRADYTAGSLRPGYRFPCPGRYQPVLLDCSDLQYTHSDLRRYFGIHGLENIPARPGDCRDYLEPCGPADFHPVGRLRGRIGAFYLWTPFNTVRKWTTLPKFGSLFLAFNLTPSNAWTLTVSVIGGRRARGFRCNPWGQFSRRPGRVSNELGIMLEIR
jgi:hypothetical protein